VLNRPRQGVRLARWHAVEWAILAAMGVTLIAWAVAGLFGVGQAQ
jgi:hypothetical protein